MPTAGILNWLGIFKALIDGLVAAEWVPVLEPFEHWVDTRYLGLLPLVV